jgi:glycerate-2-kinase
MRDAREDARAIFTRALEEVNPGRLLERRMSREGNQLRIRHDRGQFSLDLESFRHVLVLGMGKALGSWLYHWKRFWGIASMMDSW